MLRLIHQQTVSGAILIDDIDDGLPNKQYHRLGSTADPNAYVRDGIIGKPKQECYVPRTQAAEGYPLIQGYINVNETQRVTHSAGKGKILGHQQAGHISVVSLTANQIAAPTLTAAVLVGDLTLTGTTFLSITPDVTTVIITGTGAVTLTSAQIIAGGGSVGAASIVIKAADIPGVVVVASSVQVLANEQLTAVIPVA